MQFSLEKINVSFVRLKVVGYICAPKNGALRMLRIGTVDKNAYNNNTIIITIIESTSRIAVMMT